MALYYAPTTNGLQKSLGAQLDAAAVTVTLNNVTGIQNKAGVFVVDRIDTSGNEKAASVREYISFAAVSGSTLTGLTRGMGGGGADQDHAVGAVVEFIPDVVWAGGIMGALDNAFTAAGALDTTKVADLSTAQTLTTKTLTTPVIASFYQDAGKTKLMTTPATANDTLAAIAATQTLTNKTYVQKVVSSTPEAAATDTLDVSTGNIFKITMPAGNITIAISNEAVGQCFMIELTQDATGSRTVTWFSTIKWAGGSAPTLTTTASKRDTFGFRVTGTDTYDGFVVGQNI